LWPAVAAAQTDFPNRAVRIVQAGAAGGSGDYVARPLAQELSKMWNVPVLVENRPGAGGTVAFRLAATSSDPYTLALVANNVIATQILYTKLDYNWRKDLVPVARLVATPHIVTVPPKSPLRSVADLVAEAKRRPGAVSFGSLGEATTLYLAAAALSQSAGIRLNHVVYRGMAPITTALLSGELDFAFGNFPDVDPHIKSGALRGFAITTPARSPLAPELPTMKELGYPEVEYEVWFGLMAPGGTPESVVAKMTSAVLSVMRMPEIVAGLRQRGFVVPAEGPKEFAAFLEREDTKVRKIVSAVGIKPLD
jgi:tripartite-type tricarboxylate transporter receptor subunit TctC